MSIIEATVFAHEQNIRRYQSLLTTPLTHLERDFIERRLCEEQRALGALSGQLPRVQAFSTSDSAQAR